MAKTTAPLLSFDAAGQIAKSLVFARWRGISYSRRYVVPANPNSVSQQFQRQSFATLREIWKRMGPLGRAPWDSYAAGRPFTGMNAFVGENRLAIGVEADMQEFIGSPGARGGLPLVDFDATTGSGSGEIDVTWTPPSLPSGWAITNAVVAAFVDQAPDAVFPGGWVEAGDASSPYALTLTGLTPSASYVLTGWLVMTKPNEEVAYSPSIGVVAAAGA